MQLTSQNGYTLIELTLVMLMLSVLAAVALPEFIDARIDAKNSATQAALGELRSAISIGVMAIQLKEDPATSPPRNPTFSELFGNAYDANHPILSGTSIMDRQTGIPENPWTKSTAAASTRNRIYDCSAVSKGALLASPNNDRGWCYNSSTGEVWANSDLNTGTNTENNY